MHLGLKPKVECADCGLVVAETHLAAHRKRVHEGVRASVPCTEPGCNRVLGSKATNTSQNKLPQKMWDRGGWGGVQELKKTSKKHN